MTRIIVDDVLREKLRNFARPLELCDESGHVLARVTPVLDPALYDLEPKISAEELQRRMQSNEKRYTTKEVLDYLEKLK